MPKIYLEPTSPDSSRDRILAFLEENGGRVSSADGCNLTASIAKGAGYANITALNAMLARMERDGLITREVRGKRTYSVALTRASASVRPQRATSPRSQHLDGKATPLSGTRYAQVGVGLPELFTALGNTLIAMREEQAELLQRVAALEEMVKPGRRPRSQVA